MTKFSALIISGGLTKNSDHERVIGDVTLTKLDPSTGEVIKQCRLPSLPHPRAGHTMDEDLVCGGSRADDEYARDDWDNRLTDCISLTQGRIKSKLHSWWRGKAWTKTHSIGRRRKHISWNSPEGVMLIGGEQDIEMARNGLSIKRISDVRDAIPFRRDHYSTVMYADYGLWRGTSKE